MFPVSLFPFQLSYFEYTYILGAVILSLTRLLDYTHHWHDIMAGAIIGIAFAFSAYRMHYRSVSAAILVLEMFIDDTNIFNPENNHMLLPRKAKKLVLAYSPPSTPYGTSYNSYSHLQGSSQP